MNKNLSDNVFSLNYIFQRLPVCSVMAEGINGVNEMEVKYLKEQNIKEIIASSEEDCASLLSTEEEPNYAIPIKIEQSDDDTFLKLKEQADIQCKVMRQASKALEVYRLQKNSFDVEMEVQAEKILLTASCKHEQISQSLGRRKYEEPVARNYAASILLKNIQIRLTDREVTTYYILVLCSENDVQCSEALYVPTKHCVVVFDDVFVFENLSCNFRLKLEVFAFVPERPERSNTHLIKSLQRKKHHKNLNTDSLDKRDIHPPSFITQGYFILSAIDFRESFRTLEMVVADNSTLSGKAQINLSISDLKIDIAKSGFITVGIPDDYGIVWNRRWCVLEETTFKQYNYPNESDGGEPISSLDLKLIGGEVDTAKRCECAKPKTLLIRLIGGNYMFLNFDTISDMVDWKHVLNEAYNFLNDWKVLLAA